MNNTSVPEFNPNLKGKFIESIITSESILRICFLGAAIGSGKLCERRARTSSYVALWPPTSLYSGQDQSGLFC